MKAVGLRWLKRIVVAKSRLRSPTEFRSTKDEPVNFELF
jgi:hypothetical protein